MSYVALTFAWVKMDTSGLDKIAQFRNDAILAETAENIKRDIKSIILAKSVYDTGALYDSIEYEKVDKNKYSVHDGVPYGVFQELGTRRGIVARPFFVPGFERNAEVLMANMMGVFE